jgi:hypothetical protein
LFLPQSINEKEDHPKKKAKHINKNKFLNLKSFSSSIWLKIKETISINEISKSLGK